MLNSKKIPDRQYNEIFYKKKNQELEDEVNTLKTRLDELRKAKNTTKVKREREVIQVESPFRRSAPNKATSSPSLENSQLCELRRSHELELQAVKAEFERVKQTMETSHSQEVDTLLHQQKDENHRHCEKLRGLREKDADCGHGDLLMTLQKQVSDLESDKVALELDRTHLKDTISDLTNELSLKEAKWCEAEQSIVVKVKASWQEKYKQWFADMETRLGDLQQANAYLQTCLRRTHPSLTEANAQHPP